MILIRLDPSTLRQSSQHINGAGQGASAAGGELYRVTLGAPSYDGQFAPGVISIGAEADARAKALANRLAELSGRLQERAGAFEAADAAAVGRFRATTAGLPLWRSDVLLRWAVWLGVPISWLERYLRLGGFLLPGRLRPSLAVAVIPSFGGLAWRGRLFSGIPRPSWWPRGWRWPFGPETVPPATDPAQRVDTPRRTSPRGSLGEIVERAERERQEEAARKAEAERQRVREEWWPTHGLNQASPEVRTAAAQYGQEFNACGPTVLAMMMNHAQASRGKDSSSVTAVDMVHQAGKAGSFVDNPRTEANEGLISFTELSSLADKNGFRMTPTLNATGNVILSADDLLAKARNGEPVAVFVRATSTGQLSPASEYDHYVIVSGVSADGSTVTLVNPLPGWNRTSNADVVPVTMSMSEFKRVWEHPRIPGRGQGFSIEPK